VSWGIRFDDPQGGVTPECLYLIAGTPVGPDGENTIMRCQDAHVDDVAVVGLGPPNFSIEIEFDLQDWTPESQMLWYHAKAHVAVGEFGIRLCGYDRYRAQQTSVWIDCDTWQIDGQVIQQVGSRSSPPTAYAKAWRVVARRPEHEPIVVPFVHPGKG
jgi:hypothetical protein